jgi:NAD+ diphosphatase
MAPPPGFTGSPLDRVEVERLDPGALAHAVTEPGARFLPLDDYIPATDGRGALAWVPLPPLPAEELVLLGRIDGAPRFAWLDPAAPPARRSPALFTIVEGLPAGEAATYAVARSLTDWHARHRFCAFCGAASLPIRAGWARSCPACGTEHFPRTDPVVIMLAEHGQGPDAQVLVGRQPIFPPGRYSALAGFLEVGEAIEEAVARELFEEAGVRAGKVRYVASQPWPFPSQLMIACIAEVNDPTIRLDTNELEDAMWVTRADVTATLTGEPGARFLPPPDYAIAHTLLTAWLDGA